MNITGLIGFVQLAALLLVSMASEAAQEHGASGTQPASPDQVVQAVGEVFAESPVPGAVFSMIGPGGEERLAAWGRADAASERPMDPAETRLRIASVSKVFVAVTVLELAERGALELDRDINDYLEGLSIPPAFDQPITLRHLLTHTAGFDERNIGRYSLGEKPWTDTVPYLASAMPPRIRPPGVVRQYSNYGSSLAGVIAEQVTGTPYPELVRQLIFEPTGMHDTSVGSYGSRLATGHIERDGKAVPVDIHWVRTAPAGNVATTAADMQRFIKLMLNGGSIEGRQVLSHGVTQAMLERRWSHHPRIHGVSLGMMEGNPSNARLFRHEGHTRGFIAGLYLFPDQGVGCFVAYNLDQSRLRHQVSRACADAFTRLDPPEAVAAGPLDPRLTPTALEGFYRSARRARSTPESLFVGLIGRASQLKVEALDDGSYRIGQGIFRPYVDNLLYSEEWGSFNGVIFDQQGQAEYVFYRNTALQRIPWYETDQFREGGLLLILLVGVSALVIWLIDAGRRRRVASVPIMLAAVLPLVSMVSMYMFVQVLRGEVFRLMLPLPAWFIAASMLPWLSIPVAAWAASVWRSGDLSKWRRTHHAVVVVGMAFYLFYAWSAGMFWWPWSYMD